MFWNKKESINESIKEIIDRLEKLENKIEFQIGANQDYWNEISSRLDTLLAAELAMKTLDKFEDYMKNVDRLNLMINEFKGCVSMARAAFQDKNSSTEKVNPSV